MPSGWVKSIKPDVTPLMAASFEGDYRKVQELLAKGA